MIGETLSVEMIPHPDWFSIPQKNIPAVIAGISNICGNLIYTLLLPRIKESRNKTIKMKNKILAIFVAPAAIPPKPNMAATIATIKKITVQRNI